MCMTATVAHWVRAFAPHAESWVFESQLRQTLVVNTVSDSSSAKLSAKGVSVTGDNHYKWMPSITVGLAR